MLLCSKVDKIGPGGRGQDVDRTAIICGAVDCNKNALLATRPLPPAKTFPAASASVKDHDSRPEKWPAL